MSLSLKNFVDININYYKTSVASGIRNTVVLIDANSSIVDFEVGTDTTFESVSDFTSQGGLTTSALYPYIQAFFLNGGQVLHYIKVTTSNDSSTAAGYIVDAIAELPNEEIMIASTCSNLVMQKVAQALSSNSKYDGINEKICVSYLHSLTVTAKSCKAVLPAVQPTTQSEIDDGIYYTRAVQSGTAVVGYLKDNQFQYTKATTFAENATYFTMKYVGNDAYTCPISGWSSNNNLVLKYGPQGIEMTILAYFSNINVYRGTIQDYNFTPETVSMFTATLNDGISTTGVLTSATVEDDTLYNNLVSNNINCDGIVSSYGVLELCANKTDGTDLMNDFVRIVLTQTVSQRIMGVLRNKLRYTQVGISVISGTITDELQRYKSYGYLTTDKVWDKASLYDESQEYLIVAEDTPLTQGYIFKILPFSSLSATEKANHKLPTIYLVIADSYSIRQIEIVGTVL